MILPVLAAQVILPVSDLLSSNRIAPTWFRAPSFPSVLVLHIQASMATTFTTMELTLRIPARSSRLGTVTRFIRGKPVMLFLNLIKPVMLCATLLHATWIWHQVDIAFDPSVGNLGVVTAASVWENLPTTSPYANWQRYIPCGRWLASLATTDARCLTAASKARTCGAVESFLSYLTPGV